MPYIKIQHSSVSNSLTSTTDDFEEGFERPMRRISRDITLRKYDGTKKSKEAIQKCREQIDPLEQFSVRSLLNRRNLTKQKQTTNWLPDDTNYSLRLSENLSSDDS